jgi:peptide chain release factor subunit 1
MPSQLDHISAQLDRLATFEPGPFPVVSLFLNMQPDQHGRDHFEPFLRKELADRVRTYVAGAPERESLAHDAERIREYVTTVDASANGLALFACGGANLFEAVQLAAPIETHRLFISDRPHLYPLARLVDEYPRYAVLLADTHSARIFVCAGNLLEETERIEGIKTKHHKMGGWSQARFQRHTENYHLQHAKEVVEALARIVRDESIGSVFIAGDEAILPLLREHLPKDVAERVVNLDKLDVKAAEREVLNTTIAALREKDAEDDRERTEALMGAYRANGLACVGVDDTRLALEMGQVDELLITASPKAIDAAGVESTPPAKGDRTIDERTADELVVKARQTSAKIRFVEDPSLLAAVGGVGAFLRFKV